MTMKHVLFPSVALALVVASSWLVTTARPRTAADTAQVADAVARGRYLVDAIACNDCHTPWKLGENGPEPDTSLAFSGHPASLVMPEPPELPVGAWEMAVSGTNTAWAGPWGVSFTANLTPDDETGLGRWTEDVFIAALRSGRHMGMGREILPPMPWPAFSKLTDADLKAVFAYLRSLKPISNKVPEPIPPRG